MRNGTERSLWTLAAALCTVAATASDWPCIRGPNGDGTSKETEINKDWNKKPPAELWRVKLDGGPQAAPSIADGRVFVNDLDGNTASLRALDAGAGKILWKYQFPGDEKRMGFMNATPACADGRVYAISQHGAAVCLDAKTGEAIWRRSLVSDFGGKAPPWGYAGSPVIDGERLIVCPGGKNSVAALNKLTGEQIWAGGEGSASYSTPAIATIKGRRQCVVFTAVTVMGIDAEKGGAPLWQYKPWEHSAIANVAVPLVIDDDKVLISSGFHKGCALFQLDKYFNILMVARNNNLLAWLNSPVLSGGRIYGVSQTRELVCLERDSLDVIWSKPEVGGDGGSVLAIDGVLIVVNSHDGSVSMLDPKPDGAAELGRFKPLSGFSIAPPVVADGKLFVRSYSTLACYDLK